MSAAFFHPFLLPSSTLPSSRSLVLFLILSLSLSLSLSFSLSLSLSVYPALDLDDVAFMARVRQWEWTRVAERLRQGLPRRDIPGLLHRVDSAFGEREPGSLPVYHDVAMTEHDVGAQHTREEDTPAGVFAARVWEEMARAENVTCEMVFEFDGVFSGVSRPACSCEVDPTGRRRATPETLLFYIDEVYAREVARCRDAQMEVDAGIDAWVLDRWRVIAATQVELWRASADMLNARITRCVRVLLLSICCMPLFFVTSFD
jgi:hypothetical protein